MRKPKGQTVDLLYIKKEEINKKTKSKPKSKTKGTTKKKKNTTKNSEKKNKEIINLDNEIIIGLTPKNEENNKKQNKKKNNKSGKKSKNTNNKKKNNTKKAPNKKEEKSNNKTTNKKIKNPKKKRNFKFIKWITVIALFIATVILFMMSSIFNIKQIVVLNNSKISSEEIIRLSKLTPGINMFKTTNKYIRSGIKENAYIEDVKIKRNVNGTVTLDVNERKTTYMLKLEKTYVYINNQGYILEISETPLKVPIITGFSTSNEEIKVGNRLNIEDLNKLDDVIKIIEASKNSPLENIITEIDITNSFNYKLNIVSEGKTIQFGDLSNINIKLQMAGKVINFEKGKKGEIYFQEDGKKTVFKEQVTR